MGSQAILKLVFIVWGSESDYTEPQACLLSDKKILYIMLPYTDDINRGEVASCIRVIRDIHAPIRPEIVTPFVEYQRSIIETVLKKFEPKETIFHGCSHGAVLLYKVLQHFKDLKNTEFHAMGSPQFFPKGSLGSITIKHIYYNNDHILTNFLVGKCIDNRVVNLLKSTDVQKKNDHVTMRQGDKHCSEPDLYSESKCMSEMNYKGIVEGFKSKPVISGVISSGLISMCAFHAVSNSILHSKYLIDMCKVQLASQNPKVRDTVQVSSLLATLLNIGKPQQMMTNTNSLLKFIMTTHEASHQGIELSQETLTYFGVDNSKTYPYPVFLMYMACLKNAKFQDVTYSSYANFVPLFNLYVVKPTFPYKTISPNKKALPLPKNNYEFDHALIVVSGGGNAHSIAATFDESLKPIVIDSNHLNHGEIQFDWTQNNPSDVKELLRTLNILYTQQYQFKEIGFAYILYRKKQIS